MQSVSNMQMQHCRAKYVACILQCNPDIWCYIADFIILKSYGMLYHLFNFFCRKDRLLAFCPLYFYVIKQQQSRNISCLLCAIYRSSIAVLKQVRYEPAMVNMRMA